MFQYAIIACDIFHVRYRFIDVRMGVIVNLVSVIFWVIFTFCSIREGIADFE